MSNGPIPPCSTDAGDTAFARAFPSPEALQTRYQHVVREQCQRYGREGMVYLLCTVDPEDDGRGLFAPGAEFRGPVNCMVPTGSEPGQLRVYFTEVDRATVEEVVDHREARLGK
jgi:hypothetical protein